MYNDCTCRKKVARISNSRLVFHKIQNGVHGLFLSDPGKPGAEVNIPSYPATKVAGSFFFRRAEILNSGGFVQKYSDQGVSCKNIGQ